MRVMVALIVFPLLFINLGCESTMPAKEDVKQVSFLQAEKMYRQREYKKSLILYQKLNMLKPNNVQVLFRLANIHAYLGENQQAIIFYNQVLKRDPRHTRSHYNLSMLHLMATQNHLFKYLAGDAPPNKQLNSLLAAINTFSSPEVEKSNIDRLADMFNEKSD